MSPPPAPEATLSIAAYQDEATLATVVREGLAALAARGGSFEVLIVEDGSHDGTLAVAERLAAEDPRVRIFRHETNLGFAATLRDLYAQARGRVVVTAPGDNQIPAADIVALLDLARDADIVIGVRRARADNLTRRLVSGFYNRLVRLLFGLDVRDLNSVKAVRREIALRLPVRSTSAFFDAEMVIRAHACGFRVVEGEVRHLPRAHGTAYGGKLAVLWAAFRDLLLLRASGDLAASDSSATTAPEPRPAARKAR